MENIEIIEFRKARDFGNKVNATFTFIRQNFKSLFKSLLFIAGPPVLVASLLLSTFMSDFFKLGLQGAGADPEMFASYLTSTAFWLQLLLMMIFLLVSFVITIGTTNSYLLLYQEKKTSQIEVSEVWERVRDSFWMYFSTTLLFSLLAIAAYALMVIPVVVLASISPLLIVLGVFVIVFVIVYLLVSVSLIYAVRAFESVGFFEALSRSFYLVQGKWWSTFGLTFLLSMLVGVISYVFFIPAYIIMIVKSLHSLDANNFQEPASGFGPVFTILMTLYYLSQIVLSCLPNIGIAFQYFNLVERKEAKGLMDKIDTLGTSTPPPVQDEHY